LHLKIEVNLLLVDCEHYLKVNDESKDGEKLKMKLKIERVKVSWLERLELDL